MESAGQLEPAVFVSYSHEDKPFAHSLAGALGDRDCNVWVDDFELRAGDSLTERVAGAVTSADFVVALVSQASVASNWCQRELQMALSTGFAEGRTIVLPLRLGSVVMPPALTDIYYVPADPADVEGAADRLVRDICSHAKEIEEKRAAAANEQEWEFALEPAHELDSFLGDLEQKVHSQHGKTAYGEILMDWLPLIDKWGSGRLPRVLTVLAFRFEGLLEIAALREEASDHGKEALHRLDDIVAAAVVQTRELMNEAVRGRGRDVEDTLELSSIPDRDDLIALVDKDPELISLHDLVVPPDVPIPGVDEIGDD